MLKTSPLRSFVRMVLAACLCVPALAEITAKTGRRSGPPPDPIGEIGYSVGADGSLEIGPRSIAVPTSISQEAQVVLKKLYQTPSEKIAPIYSRYDREKLVGEIRKYNAFPTPAAEEFLASDSVKVTEEKNPGGAGISYVGTPKNLQIKDRGVLVLHGGALVMGGGINAKMLAASKALNCNCVAYSVDYRMPPDHPYPAALDDVVATYREMLKKYKPGSIVIEGASAGGNLAAAATLKIRDMGLPMPAAVVLLSPEVDLTESGDTFQTHIYLDGLIRGSLMPVNQMYADGVDLKEPYISPLFGDFKKGFPPTFIQSGTRDLFLSNSVRMHRALRNAGVEAELHVWEGMPHCGFVPLDKGWPDAPENGEILKEIGTFMQKHWRAG